MSRTDEPGRERPEGEELLGRVVTSQAGRDAGARYVVIALADGDAVLVADGRRRPVERPKRKNIKHLAVEDDAPLRERLRRGERLTDEDIRAAVGPREPSGGE